MLYVLYMEHNFFNQRELFFIWCMVQFLSLYLLFVLVYVQVLSKKQGNMSNNNNNSNDSEFLLGAIIHRPDAPLASQEEKESEN